MFFASRRVCLPDELYNYKSSQIFLNLYYTISSFNEPSRLKKSVKTEWGKKKAGNPIFLFSRFVFHQLKRNNAMKLDKISSPGKGSASLIVLSLV